MQAREPRLLSVKPVIHLLFCGIFLISAHAVLIQPAWGESPDHHRPQAATKSKKPRVGATPASLAPVTVRNLRVMTSPGKTRLVMDLDRHTKVIEQREDNPSRVVIALSNASLSQPALAKAADGTVPSLFMVSQLTPHIVAVSLPTTSFRTYKQFALSDPPRLVVDVTPSIDQGAASPNGIREIPSRSSPPSPQPIAPPAKDYTTIVIDPGHGGKDPGARGLRRTEEKDITLKVGLQLRELLSKQPGMRVMMTRDRDVFVELGDRAKFANSHEADLFVSIHVNSHPSRSVKGIEIYHFGEAKDQRALEVAARENGTPISNTGVGWEYFVADLLTTKKIEESLELAWNAKEAMVAQMNGHYAVNDHGVKTAPFYVLRFTSMPSILAEIAYISNPTEEDLLQKPVFVRDVAQSLYQGIVSFLASNRSDIR
ncbi:MAG: N-acetylmuramoyl-L-alanine amidase [Nitrospira sp. BO4]|jgi:N-acetylmuramoyl-L-alanine amidase|nr:N-acetylmuramoyl-L-alanine amidase [Nitrospira sp. BO4]